MAPPNTTNWARYELKELKIELDIFADLSTLTLRQDGDLTSLVQDSGPIRIVLWAGPDQTLESWRKRLDLRGEANFADETAVTICGLPGRKQIATVNCAGSRGAFLTPAGKISHLYTPASSRLHICLSFPHTNRNILICWIVDREARPNYADEESRFFQAIKLLPAAMAGKETLS